MSPIRRLQNQWSSNPKGLFSSIDLSAATDRLPISMQVKLLEVLLSDIVPDSRLFAEAWRDILVSREYSTGLSLKNRHLWKKIMDIDSDIPSSVTYSVGQPMGALSS